MKFSVATISFVLAFIALAEASPANTLGRRGNQFVTGPCTTDSDCQQGCCAFSTGKCAGPAIAQTRDGGCGFGNPKPNCNVAAALKLSDCVAGAVNGDLSDSGIQSAAEFVSKLDGIPFTPTSGSAAAPPPPAASKASTAAVATGTQFVTGACKTDNDCQQGCCAFNTGKCAGPGIAQTRDGGCGFGNAKPNCNVAAALKLSECVPGAANGDLNDPHVVAAAEFVSKLDNIPFTAPSGSGAAAAPPPPPAASKASTADVATGTQFVTGACKTDNDCQEGCCAFNTGKCAGPGIAQTRDGGCGFGNAKPNCNVAAALKLNTCAAGAVNGNLNDPHVVAAAKFVSKLDNIPFNG